MRSSRRRADRALARALALLAAASGGLVLAVVVFLAAGAWPALREVGLGALTRLDWHPTARPAQFGLSAMVVGSLLVAGGALALAAPVGVLAACFTHLVAGPRTARLFRRGVELLAGVPSVVYGLWGLTELVPLLRGLEPPGTSLLAGALVLALMVVPTIAMLSDAAFLAVPSHELAAARALALGRVGVLRTVLLPRAARGIRLAVLLGLLRALGETMAVLMVTGNIAQLPGGPFDSVRALTANIALELGYASGVHRSVLYLAGLLLLVVVLALLLTPRLVGARSRVRGEHV